MTKLTKMGKIGDKIWFKDEQVTIATLPYILYGGEFYDVIKGDGTIVTVPTIRECNKKEEYSELRWAIVKNGFRKL